jgi:hypothetical protein
VRDAMVNTVGTAWSGLKDATVEVRPWAASGLTGDSKGAALEPRSCSVATARPQQRGAALPCSIGACQGLPPVRALGCHSAAPDYV